MVNKSKELQQTNWWIDKPDHRRLPNSESKTWIRYGIMLRRHGAGKGNYRGRRTREETMLARCKCFYSLINKSRKLQQTNQRIDHNIIITQI